MTPANIDLDAFIDLLDGQIDEGDNGTFYLDKSGIRAIVPDVSARQALGLFSAEKEALRQFEKDCRLRFPCTIQDVRQWIERTGEADMPDSLAEPVEAAEATEPASPTVKPGPQAAIPDEALDHYEQLRAKGTDWFNAATDTIAIERFNLDGINPDSIKRASNRRRRVRG